MTRLVELIGGWVFPASAWVHIGFVPGRGDDACLGCELHPSRRTS